MLVRHSGQIKYGIGRLYTATFAAMKYVFVNVGRYRDASAITGT